MISLLVALCCLTLGARAAPTAGDDPLLAQQFVVLSPPQAAHSIQYEPTTVLKLDQPLFQQITPLGRLETPQKQQLLLLYPNGPLTQYPLISVRQDGGAGGVGGDFWQSIQNFFQNIGGQFGNTEAPPVAAPPPAAASSDAIIRAEPTVYSAAGNAAGALFEAPAQPAAAPVAVMPASTQPLSEKRYYILSGQPQFFGKYDAFHTPLNSVFHLQPLQQSAAIESRSATAEPAPAAFDGPQIAADAEAAYPATAEFVQLPLQQQAVPLQLRSAFQEPLHALEPSVVESAAAAFVPAEAAQFVPVAAALKNAAVESNFEVPRSLPVAPESENDDVLSSEKVASVAAPSDDTVQVDARANVETDVAAAAATELENEPQQSVANARPTGVAVAGRGGLASSKPSATAVVGDGGLAMAAPLATAISGEFEEEEEVVVEEESKKFEKKD